MSAAVAVLTATFIVLVEVPVEEAVRGIGNEFDDVGVAVNAGVMLSDVVCDIEALPDSVGAGVMLTDDDVDLESLTDLVSAEVAVLIAPFRVLVDVGENVAESLTLVLGDEVGVGIGVADTVLLEVSVGAGVAVFVKDTELEVVLDRVGAAVAVLIAPFLVLDDVGESVGS